MSTMNVNITRAVRTVRRQPVAVVTLVEVTLALLLAFGLNLSGEQVAAIVAFANAVLGVWAWHKVTPTADPQLEHITPEV